MMDLSVHIKRVARHLLGEPNKVLTKRDELRFGTNGSVSVMIRGPKQGTWYDHENLIGGGVREMLLREGVASDSEAIAEWFKRELGIDINPGKQRIVAEYNYTCASGELLFQVVRFGPNKDFRQRRPDGRGGGFGGLNNTVKRVLYNLPQLIAAKAKGNGTPWRGYIVEGEKDVDRLTQWRLTATTNPGGAGKWRAEYNQYFAGAEVVIVPDNDKAGRDHAAAIAASVAPYAAAVKIVEFTGLPEKGDISDWIAAGGTQGDIEDLVDATPPYRKDPNWREPDDDGIPVPPGQPEVKSAGHDYGPIPPRQWLLGTHFCRGFLSGLTGAGAVGKTAIRLLQFSALALGRGDLTGDHVFARTKVLIVCLEDDEDELRRRIRAVCIHHNLDQSELDGWLYYWTRRCED